MPLAIVFDFPQAERVAARASRSIICCPEHEGASARMCRSRIRARIVFKVNDCDMTLAMVAAGEGISALLPRAA